MAQGVPFDLPQWITLHGLPVVSEGTWQQAGYRWVLNPCPWDSAHTNKSAFVVQFASGAIAAGCHHNGCHGNNWHELRDLYEPGWQTRSRSVTLHISSNGHPGQPSTSPGPAITSGQAQQGRAHRPTRSKRLSMRQRPHSRLLTPYYTRCPPSPTRPKRMPSLMPSRRWRLSIRLAGCGSSVNSRPPSRP
jgi:hypothetical protein